MLLVLAGEGGITIMRLSAYFLLFICDTHATQCRYISVLARFKVRIIVPSTGCLVLTMLFVSSTVCFPNGKSSCGGLPAVLLMMVSRAYRMGPGFRSVSGAVAPRIMDNRKK